MIKNIISLIMSFIIFIFSSVLSIFPQKASLRVIAPENWEMSEGDSRTLDYVFDDKTTDRRVKWSVSPADVATVDEWGRVTALKEGTATVTGVSGTLQDSVELKVVKTPTKKETSTLKVDYGKKALAPVENLQKLVTRYPISSDEIPARVKNQASYSSHQSTVTADGAKWEITDYGVLRTDKNAPTERDREQRFMGDRYFYSSDSTDGKVLAIFADGENGIWTVMQDGVTHIEMVEMSGDEKAAVMSANTQKYVSRLGFTSKANIYGDDVYRYDDDNDGLWTSMYGAGELMRYATLKNDPESTAEELAAAKKAALSASEAILMLHYVSMRTGTVEAYVRHRNNGSIPGSGSDRQMSAEALVKGGDYSVMTYGTSPAKTFEKQYIRTLFTGKNGFTDNDMNKIVSPEDWKSTRDPANSDVEFAKQTRLIKGFVPRTFSLSMNEINAYDNVYWTVNDDNTATGYSIPVEGRYDYIQNNEDMRGVKVDASGEIPQRLWNDVIGSGYTEDDIVYKGDTSADELIGHIFIYKLMFDVLGDEDPELRALMVESINDLAQHMVDNSYQLIDATGQPATWSQFDRGIYNGSSGFTVAPLHAMVLLTLFKTAAYITGYQKWEDEYRLAALDPAYEYAKVLSQESERMLGTITAIVSDAASPLLASPLKLLSNTKLYTLIRRMVTTSSDEEMAMLGYYLLFQLETDSKLLGYYTDGIDDWWETIKYSENPCWYVIYQLAHPNKRIKDAYGNNIMDLTVWSLDRHPIDTRKYLASNDKRDDIAQLSVPGLGLKVGDPPSYNLKTSAKITPLPDNPEVMDYVKFALTASQLDFAIAATDERAMHKFNGKFNDLTSNYAPNHMEASTTYTLPYWMARYHGILEK